MGSSCVDTHTAVSFVTTQLANYKSQQGDLDLGALYGAALADGRQDGAMNHGGAKGRNARATKEIDKSSMTGGHSSGIVLRLTRNFGGNYFSRYFGWWTLLKSLAKLSVTSFTNNSQDAIPEFTWSQTWSVLKIASQPRLPPRCWWLSTKSKAENSCEWRTSTADKSESFVLWRY